MSDKKKDDVSSTSYAYDRMKPRWHKIETLLGGTEAMRAAGEVYLPRHQAERDKSYNNRLDTAVLYNYTELTLNSLAARPFDESMELEDGAPENFVEMAEDIDLQGNNLHRFCESWFKDGLAKGFSHTFIDFPVVQKLLPDGNGGERPRTLEDDRLEGVRPFWLHIKPENLIFAAATMVRGKERLDHIRFTECSMVREGFIEKVQKRVRVVEPGYYEIWELKDKDKWERIENGAFELPFIPLVTFYASKREGLMECKPPLVDLADLNIRHWQSDADQQNVLTVTRFPILAVSGVEDAEKVVIGPNQWLSTPTEQGKWYYVEHTGAAIEAGANDLSKLEDRMASYGAEFLKKKPVAETASARILDEAGAISPLTAMARNFKDAVELALRYTANWLKLDDGPGIVMKTEFDEEEFGEGEIKDLLSLRTQRELSREAFFNELKRRRFISEDYDAEADKELIDEEAPDDSDLGGMFPGGKTNGGLPAPGQQPKLPAPKE